MLVAAFLALALQAPAPVSDARQVSLASPQIVADVDAGKMKGDIVRLAWSPDGSEFYLQIIELDSYFNVKSTKHYIVSTAARSMKSVDQEPEWASKYWLWKSGQTSPGSAAFKISVDEREETKRSVAAPTGGVLAKGGTADPTAGTTNADAASAAENAQRLKIYALKVKGGGTSAKGETLGEWTNEPVRPGVNFTWAPAPMRLIAFTKREGSALMVLDEAGRKEELAGAKAAILPAWSNDGKRIAWLERKERKKYQLMVAEVGSR